MLRSSRLIMFVVAVAALLVSSPAFAKQSLTAPLGEIEWGDSKEEVLEKLKKQMLDKLRERDDLRRDRVKMQRARKAVIDQHERIEESYEELDGNSGYDISVIADEFEEDQGQSLLKVKDTHATRFYFFHDGELYKLVVGYNQQYLQNVGFDAFVVQVAKKYGRPDTTEYGEIAGDEELVFARWENPDNILRIENKREFFGTFKMVFADRHTVEQLGAARTSFKTTSEDEGVSSQVEDLKSGPVRDEEEDVVDGMVGDVDVDLNRGRPEDQQVRRGEKKKTDKTEKSEVASKDSPSKSASDKSDDKDEKEEKKDRDFSDLESESDGGDDLIIY